MFFEVGRIEGGEFEIFLQIPGRKRSDNSEEKGITLKAGGIFQEESITFGDISTGGQNGFKKKPITISIGFCTSLKSVIVKVLFTLTQQVVLREYS